MVLTDLINMTRIHARDNNAFMFTDSVITTFLNQAIDRLAQYPVFKNMPYLSTDSPTVHYLPRPYHYILSLFAAARCYDTDERFYEGTEKRNEFEHFLDNLIADIETGNIVIYDENNTVVQNTNICTDTVKDVYFSNTNQSTESELS